MKILLHICCAPCSTEVIERLRKEGFDVTGFFYNPNIQPNDEYEKRLDDARLFAKMAGIELIEGDYNPSTWTELTSEFSSEPEGGSRCPICFRVRFYETGKIAKKHNYDFFTTTLSISPHKNSMLLNDIGRSVEEDLKVKYYEANFKKKNGYLNSILKSQEMGLYRQDYCGCIYSKKERENQKKTTN